MIEIRRMTQADTAQIAALERACFSDPWSEKSIESELSNDLSLWLVAADAERVAGYVGSQAVLGEADMMNLAVLPDYRRRGLGEKLVSELIQRLNDAGNYALTLEVRASNEPARALYEKLGFRLAGRRPNYYEKPKEDALILKKEWMA